MKKTVMTKIIFSIILCGALLLPACTKIVAADTRTAGASAEATTMEPTETAAVTMLHPVETTAATTLETAAPTPTPQVSITTVATTVATTSASAVTTKPTTKPTAKPTAKESTAVTTKATTAATTTAPAATTAVTGAESAWGYFPNADNIRNLIIAKIQAKGLWTPDAEVKGWDSMSLTTDSFSSDERYADCYAEGKYGESQGVGCISVTVTMDADYVYISSQCSYLAG